LNILEYWVQDTSNVSTLLARIRQRLDLPTNQCHPQWIQHFLGQEAHVRECAFGETPKVAAASRGQSASGKHKVTDVSCRFLEPKEHNALVRDQSVEQYDDWVSLWAVGMEMRV